MTIYRDLIWSLRDRAGGGMKRVIGRRHTTTGRSQQKLLQGAVLELRAHCLCQAWLEREGVKDRPSSGVSPSFYASPPSPAPQSSVGAATGWF